MKTTNQKTLDRIRNAGLNPPEALTLMITRGCNLSCHHCLLDCRPHTEVTPVPTEVILKWIKEFAALGGKQIIIAGGEPLCHPDWHQILTFCCRHTGFQEVCLHTNATLLTPSRVHALRKLPKDKLSVQISLDGASADTHDYVRGPETYKKALDGIRLLAEFGLGGQTRIAFTEMVHNFKDLPALLEIVDQLGISRLVSGTLLKGGRAARNDRIDMPLPSQYRELITRYHEDDLFRKLYHRRGNIAAIEWYNGMSRPSPSICSCIKNLFINADGWMYPCVMIPAEKYAVKAVHHRTLDELIIESLPLWTELPQIGKRREIELEFCQDCPGKNHCLGGCIGRAYTAYGDFMEVEDRCALRRAVYCYSGSHK